MIKMVIIIIIIMIMYQRWPIGKRSQQLQKRPHLHLHLPHRPQAGQGQRDLIL